MTVNDTVARYVRFAHAGGTAYGLLEDDVVKVRTASAPWVPRS